jgi:CHAT domain-containing protein
VRGKDALLGEEAVKAKRSGLVLALILCANAVAASDEVGAVIDTAARYRRDGNLRLSIELLETARSRLGASCPARLNGELGATYFQAHRLADADKELTAAYAKATAPGERALIANDLGNLSASLGRKEEAARYYRDVGALAGQNTAVAVSAGLNLARLASEDQRLNELTSLSDAVAGVADVRDRARFLTNLGSQASALGKSGAKLAYRSLDQSVSLAREVKDRWLLAEALDSLAQLYEDHGRTADALRLTEEAIAQLRSEPPSELMVGLEWRRGRLYRTRGRDDLAFQSYQSAVEQIEAIRQDIPVDYVDGRSSFRATLEPIYLGLAGLALDQAERADPAQRAQLYRRARDTVELIKQTELQDYLGDRCLVESSRPLAGSSLPPRTAVLYPVILDKRLALLLETRDGIQARHVDVDASALRAQALAFAASVREAKPEYMSQARALYDLLLRPIEPLLAQNQVDTLVVVPDGALRLIPLAALHDGERFAIAKYAIATAPGLTITSAPSHGNDVGKVLLAGLSEPGPVVDKLPKAVLEQLGGPAATRGVSSAALRDGLALPGVTDEIQALKKETKGQRLLNSEFTVARFRSEVGSGGYRVVHIASHAVFSQRAQTSFILAYDNVITIDELQTLLRGEDVQRNPIDLLSLSACQTAEGDDRAPLGIAGAALRAHAGSALGSLWPVDDEATKTLMVRFYELMLTSGGSSKAKALQRAQLELIGSRSFDHPFFWAPFILVGSWQ